MGDSNQPKGLQMALAREEVHRKLLHLMALLMPVGIFYGPVMLEISPVWITATLAVLFILSLLMEGLRFNSPAAQVRFAGLFHSMLRKEEDRQVTGSTYIIGGCLFCAVVFQNERHIAFMVLSLFILGDGLAALVGQRYGRIRIGEKSLEGSLACFGLCLAMFWQLFPRLPFLLDAWGQTVSLPVALLTSLSITVFELMPLKLSADMPINDNLAVPVISGVVMQIAHWSMN